MEGFLNIRGSAADGNDHAAGVGVEDFKAVGCGKVKDFLVIRLAWAKFIGELVFTQVMAVLGALGIVNLLDEIIQSLLVTDRKADRQGHYFIAGHFTSRGRRGKSWKKVAVKFLAADGLGLDFRDRKSACKDEKKKEPPSV